MEEEGALPSAVLTWDPEGAQLLGGVEGALDQGGQPGGVVVLGLGLEDENGLSKTIRKMFSNSYTTG